MDDQSEPEHILGRKRHILREIARPVAEPVLDAVEHRVLPPDVLVEPGLVLLCRVELLQNRRFRHPGGRCDCVREHRWKAPRAPRSAQLVLRQTPRTSQVRQIRVPGSGTATWLQTHPDRQILHEDRWKRAHLDGDEQTHLLTWPEPPARRTHGRAKLVSPTGFTRDKRYRRPTHVPQRHLRGNRTRRPHRAQHQSAAAQFRVAQTALRRTGPTGRPHGSTRGRKWPSPTGEARKYRTRHVRGRNEPVCEHVDCLINVGRALEGLCLLPP